MEWISNLSFLQDDRACPMERDDLGPPAVLPRGWGQDMGLRLGFLNLPRHDTDTEERERERERLCVCDRHTTHIKAARPRP